MEDGSQRTRLRKLEGVIENYSDEPFVILNISLVGSDEPEERWAFYADGRRRRLDKGTGPGTFDDNGDTSNGGDAR